MITDGHVNMGLGDTSIENTLLNSVSDNDQPSINLNADSKFLSPDSCDIGLRSNILRTMEFPSTMHSIYSHYLGIYVRHEDGSLPNHPDDWTNFVVHKYSKDIVKGSNYENQQLITL